MDSPFDEASFNSEKFDTISFSDKKDKNTESNEYTYFVDQQVRNCHSDLGEESYLIISSKEGKSLCEDILKVESNFNGEVTKPEDLVKTQNGERFYSWDGSLVPDSLIVENNALEGIYREEMRELLDSHSGDSMVVGDKAYSVFEGVEAVEEIKGIKKILNKNFNEEFTDYLGGYEDRIDKIHNELTEKKIAKEIDDYEDTSTLGIEKSLEKANNARQDIVYLNVIMDAIGTENILNKQRRLSELAYLVLDDLVQKENFITIHYGDTEQDLLKELRSGVKEDINKKSVLEYIPKPHNIDEYDALNEELGDYNVEAEMGSLYEGINP